jgi:hypothetical protein
MEAEKTQQLEVTVTFPLGETPFHDRYAESATIGEVRAAAMNHFGVVEDPQYTYYLTHNGERQNDATTLGSIVEHAHGLKLTLVKELIQG